MTTGGAVPPLRQVGVVLHPAQPAAFELGKALGRWARQHRVELRTLVSERGGAGPDAAAVETGEFIEGLDLVVVLGGDGTLLRALSLAVPAGIPVLGVNLGRLGFLAEVEPDDLVDALDAVRAGRGIVEARMTLCARVLQEGAVIAEDLAVNDVVIDKAARERLATISVTVDARPLARYVADGIIVATPTGSTAYSFSAGGPIVSPRLDALVLTPVAPHMVFNRTLVLHPDEVLRLDVAGEAPVAETVDGRWLRQLDPGRTLEVGRGPTPAKLVRVASADFYGLVRSKFRLADAGGAQPSR